MKNRYREILETTKKIKINIQLGSWIFILKFKSLDFKVIICDDHRPLDNNKRIFRANTCTIQWQYLLWEPLVLVPRKFCNETFISLKHVVNLILHVKDKIFKYVDMTISSMKKKYSGKTMRFMLLPKCYTDVLKKEKINMFF